MWARNTVGGQRILMSTHYFQKTVRTSCLTGHSPLSLLSIILSSFKNSLYSSSSTELLEFFTWLADFTETSLLLFYVGYSNATFFNTMMAFRLSPRVPNSSLILQNIIWLRAFYLETLHCTNMKKNNILIHCLFSLRPVHISHATHSSARLEEINFWAVLL